MELDWNKYMAIATRFQYKAKFEDREDLKQDIILRLAEIASNNGHKPFTEGAMIRVASYTVMAYWRDLMRKPYTLRLSDTVCDCEGNSVELYEILADDKAVDLEAWQDAKTWLLGCPKRLITIAYKRHAGKPLDVRERNYLQYQKQKTFKRYQKLLTF
jgi:hypothetical protein